MQSNGIFGDAVTFKKTERKGAGRIEYMVKKAFLKAKELNWT